MMKKIILFSTINLFFLIGLSSKLIGQNETEAIVVNGRSFGDNIVLRWAPTDMNTWKLGNNSSYQVFRVTYDENDEVVDYTTFGPFQVLPEADWLPLIENDNYAGLAYHLLYSDDPNIYEGVDVLEQFEMEENRFSFALFAADVSLSTAFNMGLGFRDETIETGNTYSYQVVIDNGGNPIRSDFFKIDPAFMPPLPTPDSLMVNFGDQTVELIWERSNLDQFYSGYYIEYKDPSSIIGNFITINEYPFVQMTSENALEGTDQDKYMFYRDSLDQNFKEYTYRVRGISPFGELGPYSDEVSGSGKPNPLPVGVIITNIQEDINQGFEIDWLINDNYQDSIKGFNIYRSVDNTDNFQLMNNGLLPINQRTYTDTDPADVNYYQLEAIDLFDNSIFSVVSMGQLNDLEPPAAPQGLQGSIDTTGLVSLSWNTNTEEDLLGYHVYFNNGPEGEFAILTSGNLVEGLTTYTDTIEAETLSEKIYYKLRAVDFRGNQSFFSEVLELERPDLIAPTEGEFKSNETDRINGRVAFTYVNSSSSDVILNELQRKQPNETNWMTLRTDTSKATAVTFVDQEALRGQSYQYRLRSVDDVGHVTISDTLNVQTFNKAITDDVLRDFNAKRSSNGAVIAWVYETDLPIKKIILYRAEGRNPMRTYKHLQLDELEVSGNIFKYTDTDAEKGKNYQYQIVIRHESGQTSNLSPLIRIGG